MSRLAGLLLTVVLFFGNAPAQAGPAGVSITIVEKKSGKPAAGSPVRIDGSPDILVTDENGRLFVKRLSAGRHTLEVIDPDYQPFDATFEVEPGKKTDLIFALDSKESEEAEEIVISATRETQNVSETRLEMSEVRKVAGTQGDLVKIVQSLPGVARGYAFGTSSGAGIVVRGAAPEDSRVMLDGHEIPLLYHFGGLKSVLNSDLLESIDFLPGGFGAEFGDAIGGVVKVDTRRSSPRRYDGYVEIGMLDAGFYVEGPLGEDAGFVAAARRSTVDIWLPHVLPSDLGLELTVAPVYYDYQAKLDWSPLAEGRLSLLVFGSHDEMKFLLNKPPSGDPSLRGDMSMWVDFHRAILKWLQAPTERVNLKLSVAAGLDRARVGMGIDRYMNISVPSLELRTEVLWDLSDGLRLAAGLEGGMADFRASMSIPRPPKEGELPSKFFTQQLLRGEESIFTGSSSAHLQAEVKPLSSLWLTAGLRADWYGPPLWDFSTSPRFGARWSPRQGTVLKAAAGLYQQAPQPDELSDVIGNPDLILERAWHYTLGLEQVMPWRMKLEVETFVKTVDRLVVPEESEKIYSNRGIGRINGLEVLLRRDAPESVFGWVAYTLMRSRRRDGPGEPWRLFDFDQTHILTVVLGWRLSTGPASPHHAYRQGWELGLRFQLVSGNPYTPVVDVVFDADYDTYQWVPGEPNSKRLPLFHQLDLRVDYTWAFEYWALSVFLDVQNVYDHRAAEAVRYNYDATEQAYIEGLPILPFLGIRGAFL